MTTRSLATGSVLYAPAELALNGLDGAVKAVLDSHMIVEREDHVHAVVFLAEPFLRALDHGHHVLPLASMTVSMPVTL
jgi:hypothetical protein